MSDRPKIVTLCGSSRFVDVMAVCAWLLERDEGAIALGLHLLPQWYADDVPDDHLAEHEGCASEMDALHLRKIEISDEVFVVNRDLYVGESTSNEIAFAQKIGKPIRWYDDDPIGADVEARIRAALAAAKREGAAL